MIVDKGKDYRQKDVRVIIKPTISGKFLNYCLIVLWLKTNILKAAMYLACESFWALSFAVSRVYKVGC